MSFRKLDKKAKKQSNAVFSRESVPRDSGGSSAGKKQPLEGYKGRLLELFSFVEQELDQLHAENATLRERIEKLELMQSERQGSVDFLPEAISSDLHLIPSTTNISGNTPLRKIKMSGQNITKRLKTYTPKKSRSGVNPEWSQVCVYAGHRDGVWQVSHARNGAPLIGTASADGMACIWDIDSTNMLLRYVGHTGSVNSIAFHPCEPIVCTASGDNSVHIWSTSTHGPVRGIDRNKSLDSSGEDRLYSDEDLTDTASEVAPQTSPPAIALKQAQLILSAHKAPVISCDWLSDGLKLVSASWDRTAKLWDSESAQVIHSLEGHDKELTHVCAHPSQELLVTSSEDATFRLWDFRAPPIHSVNVFQGHSKAVNSATFSSREFVVSGSDDHSIKLWDLRNMRAPVDSVRVDCGVNRLSVSHGERTILAVPLDNRHIKLYDLTGNRLAHLPNRNSQGHRRMVYSVAWSHDSLTNSDRCNLFSSGFDRQVIGWKITM